MARRLCPTDPEPRRTFVGALLAASLYPTVSLRAQQPGRTYRLGYLAQRPLPFLVEPLTLALRERGWVVGKNVLLEVRATGGDPGRADAMAKELVESGADLIVVAGSHMALDAKRATSRIPVVMMVSGYPVEAGIVASYARPGGNVTGLATYGGKEFFTKFVELLSELLPSLREMAVLWDYLPPAFGDKEIELAIEALRLAAQAKKVKLHFWMIRTGADLDKALTEVGRVAVGALFVTTGPVHGQPQNVGRINELALRRKLPMMNDIPGSVFRGGGLLAYSVGWKEVAERTASFIDRILNGATPAELPIEQPTRFELTVNLKTAKALGIAIPPVFQLRIDRVIE